MPSFRLPDVLILLGRIVGHFSPLCRAGIRKVALLGIGAACANAAGYLTLHPLLQLFTDQASVVSVGPARFAATPGSYALIISVSVLCLLLALWLNYSCHMAALGVQRTIAQAAAVEGVLMVAGPDGASHRLPINITTRAINEITGQVSFACGFALRQVSLGIADVLQLCVFLSVLIWLHPGLTIVIVTVALFVGVYFVRSLGTVATTAEAGQALARRARQDLRETARIVSSTTYSKESLRQHLDDSYRNGSLGALLESKLDIHQEMKRGPLLIESIYPVALIVLPLALLATDTLNSVAGSLIVYVLILRHGIALSHGIASLLISVGRHQPQLACFSDVLDGRERPRCAYASDHNGRPDSELMEE